LTGFWLEKGVLQKLGFSGPATFSGVWLSLWSLQFFIWACSVIQADSAAVARMGEAEIAGVKNLGPKAVRSVVGLPPPPGTFACCSTTHDKNFGPIGDSFPQSPGCSNFNHFCWETISGVARNL